MSCSAIMAVVYILGVSPADETAVCFGTEESGAFAPAAFEERRHSPGTTDALKGVKTLVLAQEVSEVGDGAFAGAPDLETVSFEGRVSSLGARAFADAPKLTCVVFASRNPVDACVDTFAGAHAQLTVVYPRDNYGPLEIMHPAAIWKNMVCVRIPWNGAKSLTCLLAPSDAVPDRQMARVRTNTAVVRYEGPRVTADGWLVRISDGIAKLIAYLPGDRNALELPAKIGGIPTSCREYGDGAEPGEEMKFRTLLVEQSSLDDLRNYGARYILAKDGCVYVRGSVPDSMSGWSFKSTCVPTWTTLDDVVSLTNGLPCESGYRYLVKGGEVAAILGNEKDDKRGNASLYRPAPNEGKGISLVVPKTMGGKPVTMLSPGLFSARADIASIEFPDTVEELPAGICYGCPNLREVKLPKSLKRIGRLAFYDCPKLSNLQIPDGVVCETWAFDNKPTADNRVILKP